MATTPSSEVTLTDARSRFIGSGSAPWTAGSEGAHRCRYRRGHIPHFPMPHASRAPFAHAARVVVAPGLKGIAVVVLGGDRVGRFLCEE